jgi:hypothetical protein
MRETTTMRGPMMTVKLHALPAPYRKDIKEAELQSRHAYADAINHEAPAYDEAAERAHDCYTDLCEQALVCCKYECYERTYFTQYCDAHANREAR